MTLDRLWAGWRSAYVSAPGVGRGPGDCVICALAASGDTDADLVLERTSSTVTAMNLFPYGSGHVLVCPRRHEPDLDELSDTEAAELMAAQRRALRAIKAAFAPDGVNLGVNQRAAAGAGVPGHLHVHVLPRWAGDTNFMTTVAEVRVLPEDVRTSFAKLRAAWPAP